MTSIQKRQQGGAVLLIALVMLLVLTVLTVTNMREVTLEGRMIANKMENQQLLYAAESAVREAEKRYYGPGNIRAKLESRSVHCRKGNVYKKVGNSPCLLQISDPAAPVAYDAAINSFIRDPLAFIKGSAAHSNWTGKKTNAAAADAYIPWMPYRGTSPGHVTALSSAAYWNSIFLPTPGVNAEYGDALEGRGTYYYLVTGQAKDRLAIQTTIANIYLGLNN